MPEFDMRDQVRMIGARICRFANGNPCLCHERSKPLCKNVLTMALECYELAHKTEMTRQEHNETNKFQESLDHGKVGRSAPAVTKKVRRRG